MVDVGDLARMLRSEDGGWSWVNVAVLTAPPSVVSADAVLLPSNVVACRGSCEPTMAWIDPATQRRHELLSLPTATGTVALQPWRAPDGDIVVSGVDRSAAYLAMSTDGGQSWTETLLEEHMAVDVVWVLAAGAGRAYAVVYTGDENMAAVPPEINRTDDGGEGWVSITAEQPEPDGNVGAVFDGELIGASYDGVLLVSSNGGTEWTELLNAPALGYVDTSTDGRVLVGYPINDFHANPYLSLDGGMTWTQTTYPTDAGG